jgi:hypothetical protein
MTYLTSKPEALQKNLEECANMVCHGQHTYVYAQVGPEAVVFADLSFVDLVSDPTFQKINFLLLTPSTILGIE